MNDQDFTIAVFLPNRRRRRALIRLNRDESHENELTSRERLALVEKGTEEWSETQKIRCAFVKDASSRHREKTAAHIAWGPGVRRPPPFLSNSEPIST